MQVATERNLRSYPLSRACPLIPSRNAQTHAGWAESRFAFTETTSHPMTRTRKIVYIALVVIAVLFTAAFLVGNLSGETHTTYSVVPSAG